MPLLNYTTAEHRARFAERLAAAMASQGPNMTHVSVKNMSPMRRDERDEPNNKGTTGGLLWKV